MVQSIELLLDPAADEAVRASWDALAAAGLPSLASHMGDSNAPHVTLMAAPDGGLEPALDAVRDALRDLDVVTELGALLLFGGHRGRWVPARQVVTTGPLLHVHAELHAAAARHAPGAHPDRLTAPDAWTPHVTLARRIRADDLPRALDVLAADPIQCRLTRARLWDSRSATVTPLT